MSGSGVVVGVVWRALGSPRPGGAIVTPLQAVLILLVVFISIFATISTSMKRKWYETNNVGCTAYAVAFVLLWIVSVIEIAKVFW